ncbi:MAG TPA: type II secretion system protein [Verrucomicrobiae bacterium]|nr:type II secretion system protein [Verrucomicrobiae bacterium]
MQQFKKNRSGFTVLEVIVTLAIIGILLTIGVVSYTGYQMRTRDTAREASARIIANALEDYYNRNGEYPNVGTMISTDPEDVDHLANTLRVDQKALLTPSAPSGTLNSIVNFASTPDSTANDVFRYQGLTNGASGYSDCTSTGWTDYDYSRLYTPKLSATKLAVIVSEPRCKAFKLSYKHEASDTWKYINSINN